MPVWMLPTHRLPNFLLQEDPKNRQEEVNESPIKSLAGCVVSIDGAEV